MIYDFGNYAASRSHWTGATRILAAGYSFRTVAHHRECSRRRVDATGTTRQPASRQLDYGRPDIDPPKLLFCDSERGARHGIVGGLPHQVTATVRLLLNIKFFLPVRRTPIPGDVA